VRRPWTATTTSRGGRQRGDHDAGTAARATIRSRSGQIYARAAHLRCGPSGQTRRPIAAGDDLTPPHDARLTSAAAATFAPHASPYAAAATTNSPVYSNKAELRPGRQRQQRPVFWCRRSRWPTAAARYRRRTAPTCSAPGRRTSSATTSNAPVGIDGGGGFDRLVVIGHGSSNDNLRH